MIFKSGVQSDSYSIQEEINKSLKNELNLLRESIKSSLLYLFILVINDVKENSTNKEKTNLANKRNIFKKR